MKSISDDAFLFLGDPENKEKKLTLKPQNYLEKNVWVFRARQINALKYYFAIRLDL